jgi:hypothetical protein
VKTIKRFSMSAVRTGRKLQPLELLAAAPDHRSPLPIVGMVTESAVNVVLVWMCGRSLASLNAL